MIQSYSRKQLNTIARDNYNVLKSYCSLLESEGYWEGPRTILKQSINAILDMYIQTVLVRMSLYCGELNSEERSFISDLTDINIYDINKDYPVEKRVLHETEKFFSSPPILLQLCGLRDFNKKSGLLGLFFDALINIQLSFAFLDTVKTALVTGFIHDYYNRVSAFMKNGSVQTVSERYVFKKICMSDLERAAEYLKEADDNFEYYKNKYLFINDSVRVTLNNRTEISSTSEQKKSVILTEVNTPEKLDVPFATQKEDMTVSDNLNRLLEELNELVGLADVKEEVKSLTNLIKIRSLRKKNNMPVMDMSFHMVFTGNPGTGKTTVARLVASIYKELGLLSKGQLIETDRSGLVAGYVGQTAIKVREVVDKAMGGVLFIDEAYSLSTKTSNDFGDEAIETLVKLMEDRRDDLVVIVAGYTEEMQGFLKSNPGLSSRFNKYIKFVDYTHEELLEILTTIADKSGYKISDEAKKIVFERICEISSDKLVEFGNARGIRNMFEKMVVNQANRLCEEETPDIDKLTMITADDVR